MQTSVREEGLNEQGSLIIVKIGIRRIYSRILEQHSLNRPQGNDPTSGATQLDK